MSKKTELVEKIKEEIRELTDYSDMLDVTSFACELLAELASDSLELLPCVDAE